MMLISFSQHSVIKGIMPGAEGHKIQLMTYKDYVSMEDSVLAETRVLDDREFVFEIDIRQTIHIRISSAYYFATLFLEPAGEYILEMDTIQIQDEFRPFYNQEELGYMLIKEPGSALNFRIDEFNRTYNEFILQNFDAVYKGRNRSIISKFYDETLAALTINKNEFLENYIRYRIASLDLTTSYGKKAKIFQTYLENRPVLYYNPEYMSFFGQYFNGYLLNNKQISQSDLRNTINIQDSYVALLDTLGKDSMLVNERIRDLVLLFGLKEFYHHPSFSKKQVISLIRQMNGQSPFAEHRQIAHNLMEILTKLEPGTQAPCFKLINTDEDSVSLREYRDKPVYLSFMTTNSIACVAEFRLLDSLFTVYGEQIQFVTVSLDSKQETIRQFKDENDYNWSFLYNGLDQDLIRNYNIKTFPQFILLDASGNIVQYPAYKPSEGIEAYFIELIKSKSREP
jgi:peroxiredoxin